MNKIIIICLLIVIISISGCVPNQTYTDSDCLDITARQDCIDNDGELSYVYGSSYFYCIDDNRENTQKYFYDSEIEHCSYKKIQARNYDI